MAELSTLELAKVDSCQTLLSEWEMVTTNPPFPTSVWQLLLLTKKKCHHDPITLQCLTPYTPTSHPSSTEVQSESIARSQGLVKSDCGSYPGRSVGHTTAAVQPGKKKIARGTSAKTFYQTLRPSYWRTLYILDSSSKFVSIEHVLSTD